MAAVNYWLTAIVFPTEASQYSSKIMSSSWHLLGDPTDSEDPTKHINVGFSGTNDNYRLLPLLVAQSEPEGALDIAATNGQMLHLMLHASEVIHVGSHQSTKPQWQVVLQLAVDQELNALIDVGSLLAGTSNMKAAEYLLSLDHFPPALRGVIFFDPDSGTDGQWMVIAKETRDVLPRSRSPIKDDEAFVLFDDARSRGADMKLQSTAVAGLTLGVGVTKDKIMQGAGRMRQLGNSQRLKIFCTPEVDRLIRTCVDDAPTVRPSSVVDQRMVLYWVMDNTVKANLAGVLQWLDQGLFYSTRRHQPGEHSIVPDCTSLEALYLPPSFPAPIGEAIQVIRRKWESSFKDLSPTSKALCNKVCQAAGAIAGDLEVVLGISQDEECEREIEIEIELEQEEEIALPPPPKPRPEQRWPIDKLFAASTAVDVHGATTCLPLSSAIMSRTHQRCVLDIDWASCDSKILVTINFLLNVEHSSDMRGTKSGSETLDFLRFLDAMIIFEDKTIVAIAEFEADNVLSELWKGRRGRFTLVNFKHLRKSLQRRSSCPRAPLFAIGGNADCLTSVSDMHLAVLKLFNGETSFPLPAQVKCLETLLATPKARAEGCELLVSARGQKLAWDESDLQRVCRTSFVPPVWKQLTPSHKRSKMGRKVNPKRHSPTT